MIWTLNGKNRRKNKQANYNNLGFPFVTRRPVELLVLNCVDPDWPELELWTPAV